MPKIIENARGLLIEETKKQINENGYDNVTIRSISRGCGMGLGTFYNYFKTKELVVAAYLLEDWSARIEKINSASEGESDPMLIVRKIHSELGEFIDNNKGVFTSNNAKKSFMAIMSETYYHDMFRKQLAEPIYKVCSTNGFENAEFLSVFTAEAITTWTVLGKTFDELEPIMKKMFIK